MERIPIPRLFIIFLKIGATSFGGNIALVAAIRRELCERRKLLTDADILDFTTVGNLMPGPLATNVTAAIGYRLRGMYGALVALSAILLPAFVLVCLLTDLYLKYGRSPSLTLVFGGIIAAVAAVITATALSLAQKNIKHPLQIILVLSAAFFILWFKGFWVTLLVVVFSGGMGAILFRRTTDSMIESHRTKFSWVPAISVAAMFLVGTIIYFVHPIDLVLQELRMIGLTFGSMSVTLFGGGYVFVPAIERVVVHTHHWTTSREFADGIALGQITPGPIAITGAFVGYKVAGIKGAVIATITVFIPPALLMLVAQQFVDRIKTLPIVEAIFKGIRPAIIGMVFASVWVIGKNAPLDWRSFAIFGTVLLLSMLKKYDSALLVIGSGLAAYLLHFV